MTRLSLRHTLVALLTSATLLAVPASDAVAPAGRTVAGSSGSAGTVTFKGYDRATFAMTVRRAAKKLDRDLSKSCDGALLLAMPEEYPGVIVDNGFTGKKKVRRIWVAGPGTEEFAFPKGVRVGLDRSEVRKAMGRKARGLKGDYLFAPGKKGRVLWARFYGHTDAEGTYHEDAADAVGISSTRKEFKKHTSSDGCGGY